MIRYRCPHCDRVCESADVLRGFTVFCLGCQRAVQVPAESTAAEEAPAPPPASAAAPAPAPASTPPPDVASPPVRVVPAAPPPVRTSPPRPRPPVVSSANLPIRRTIRLYGLAALLVVVLLAAAVMGSKWHRQRKAEQAELARRETRARLIDEIRENFAPDALQRLAARHPRWDMTPSGPVLIRGKLAVLSYVAPPAETLGFWGRMLARWPWEIRDDGHLLRQALELGAIDDLMFELPEERWAGGVAETDALMVIRWLKEPIGGFDGPTLIEESGRGGSIPEPRAMRWRADVLILDCERAQLMTRRDFRGEAPAGPPAANQAEAVGPRPIDELLAWQQRAESGALKNARE